MRRAFFVLIMVFGVACRFEPPGIDVDTEDPGGPGALDAMSGSPDAAPTPVDASSPTPDAASDYGTIRIQARIDGRSHIVLRGTQVQWHHIQRAAPGRDDARVEPTFINDKEWFPDWPDVPNQENRDCDCMSDVFRPLVPRIPSDGRIAQLRNIQVRGSASIVQQPEAVNEYTLIVQLNDNGRIGSAEYIVEIDIPEPTSP